MLVKVFPSKVLRLFSKCHIDQVCQWKLHNASLLSKCHKVGESIFSAFHPQCSETRTFLWRYLSAIYRCASLKYSLSTFSNLLKHTSMNGLKTAAVFNNPVRRTVYNSLKVIKSYRKVNTSNNCYSLLLFITWIEITKFRHFSIFLMAVQI